MYDSKEQSNQSRIRISVAQKASIIILVSVFIVMMGLIIYDKQLVEPDIFAVAGIIIVVILLSTMYLFISKLINKLDEAYGKIELMAITDELTQLFNRKHFNTLFEIELTKAIRYRRHLTCFILDIDHFKEITDKYGQPYGNEVLQDTSEVIKDNSRATDIVARYDSDKFICLLPETKAESALILAKRLRALVEGTTFYVGEDNQTIHVSISIGYTSCKPCLDQGIDIYKIIKIADKAVDIAKEKGGNKVEYLNV